MTTLVLLWLAPAAARAALQPDLDAWAFARMARLVPPPAGTAPGSGHGDAGAADIERLLEEARTASGSLDAVTAEARLDEAERLVHGHADLPQAAWLMAEVLSARAVLAERQPDGAERARAWRQRAAALEGAREPEFGSEATAVEPPPTAPLAIAGTLPDDQLVWDGVPAHAPIPASASEHHLRVLRDGRQAWSGWVDVHEGQATLRVDIPVQPCSSGDLGTPRVSEGRVVADAGVACSAWAVARPAEGGGIDIATCHGSRCGSLLRWRRGYGETYRGPAQPPRRTEPPAAVTWVLLGLGVAATTALVLVESGAFDDPAPGRVTRRYYGPSSAGLSF